MGFWENVQKDVQKGVKEGFAVIKLKAGQLSDEGKRQIKLFDLKNKVHKEMADLGGAVYSLAAKGGNPLEDNKASKIVDKIKKLETQISGLEKKPKKAIAAKKKAAPKKKKAVAKKKAAPKNK